MKKRKYLIYLLTICVLYIPIVNAACPFGQELTKDLSGALKIFRIVAPLLMLGFTIFDLVKMLASGFSAEGKEAPPPKQVGARFVKRLGAVLLLFILPTMINLIFQFAGVWNEYGTCDIYDADNNEYDQRWDWNTEYTSPSARMTKRTTREKTSATTSASGTATTSASGGNGTTGGGNPVDAKNYTVPKKYKTTKCPSNPAKVSDDTRYIDDFIKKATNLDPELDNYFKVAGALTGVDSNLLKALSYRESGITNVPANGGTYGGYMGVSMTDKWGTGKAMNLPNTKDPLNNILAGAGELAYKLNQYNGDLTAALMAYNMGAGNYNKGAAGNPSQKWKDCQAYYAGRIINYYNKLNSVDPSNDAAEANLDIYGGAK